MQTTFLLLDFENVQPDDVATLGGGPFKIKVFLGAHQTKVPVSLVCALQAFGPDVEYIQMEGNGHNALDFHIAYYLGRLAVEHPKARFRILSRDAGFDPLIAHLRSQKVLCERSPTLADLRPILPPKAKPAADPIALVVADLVKRQAARPRTLKTLTSTIHALFQKQLSADELGELLDTLMHRGVVKVSDGKLSCELPEAP